MEGEAAAEEKPNNARGGIAAQIREDDNRTVKEFLVAEGALVEEGTLLLAFVKA